MANENMRVWWSSQVPINDSLEIYPIKNIEEAKKKIDELTKRDLANDSVSDNVGGLEIFEDNDWAEWTSDETGNDIFEESECVKECSCGYSVEKGHEGCGEVLEEWTKEDEDGKIIDNGWYHCGENEMLCDECKEKKHDVLLGQDVQEN